MLFLLLGVGVYQYRQVGGTPLVVQSTYLFTNPGALPVCSGVSDCDHLALVDGGTAVWNAFDDGGSTISGMAQGTTSFVSTFSPGLQALNDTVDNGPLLTNSRLDPLQSGDMEVMFFGYSTTQTSSVPYLFESTGNHNALQVRSESGNLNCIWSESGSNVTASVNLPPLNGWSVTTCRRSGAHHIARVNGADGTDVVASHVMTPDTGSYESYGWGKDFTTNPGRGPLAGMIWYTTGDLAGSRALANEMAFWGLPDAGVTANTSPAQLIGSLNQDGVNIDLFAAGSAIVHPTYGVHTQLGFTNYWSSDPLDFSTAVQLGNPTITANVASGPFQRWRDAAECDRVYTPDGGTGKGGQSTLIPIPADLTGATYNSAYAIHHSGWLIAGDAGSDIHGAWLNLYADGGLLQCSDAGYSQVCSCYADLTTTPTLFGCDAIVVDAGATLNATVYSQTLIANDAGNTGSFIACQVQTAPGSYQELFTVDGSPHGSGHVDLDASGWPHDTGKYEVNFYPLWNIGALGPQGWQSQVQSTMYVFDTFDSTPNHVMTMVPGYNQFSEALWTFRNEPAETNIVPTALQLTPLTSTTIAGQFVQVGSGCTDTALLNGLTKGAQGGGVCPNTPVTARLGDRLDLTIPTSEWVHSVTIYKKKTP
jgi:hypothetical protein